MQGAGTGGKEKATKDRDGQGWTKSSQQWAESRHELLEVGRDGHCLPRGSAACIDK